MSIKVLVLGIKVWAGLGTHDVPLEWKEEIWKGTAVLAHSGGVYP
jgi:hypothetical protein